MNPSIYHYTRALREGRAQAISIVKQSLDAIAANEERLAAYRVVSADRATSAAGATDAALAAGADPGPLAGVPVSIKDLYGIDGLTTFAGTPRAVPDAYNTEGPLVRAVKNQLAALCGKTHTVEFAFGGLGVNSHHGTPRNPWDASVHRVPGGSSAGAGVSLHEGAWLALGTDTAGSVRIPASMTGTVGLKTSAGRWPLEGIFPLSPTLDTAGVLARSVEDVAFAFAALDPWIEESPWRFVDRLREEMVDGPVLGTGESALWQDCQASITGIVESTLRELAGLGATCIEALLPEAADAQELLRLGNVVSAELAEMLASEMPGWLETLDPLVGVRIRDGGAISASDWLARRRRLDRIAATSATRFDDCDVIACPTVAISVPRLDAVSELSAYRSANLACLHNTCVANSLSLCALTLPAGLDEAGMPVGLQLIAPHGAEERLLAVALWIEDRLGTPAQRLGAAPGATQVAS